MHKTSYRFFMLPEEYWWTGCIDDAPLMPLDGQSVYSRSLDPNASYNQAAPLLLSSRGRYIWCDSGFDISVEGGCITLATAKGEPVLHEGYDTLRGAYLAAMKRHFPFSSVCPPADFFITPQFNTWIELTYFQNQQAVLRYARDIRAQGYPAGVLMIDCGWQEYYGRWEFHPGRFPDPKGMVDELHRLGFRVMLWTCPYISPDSLEFRSLWDKGLLVRNPDGSPSIKEWWDGYSAVLDFTHPEAVDWFDKQNGSLMERYGVDGFKLDAGDAFYYSDDDLTHSSTDANGQSELWAEFGVRYAYNEYRASWKCGGLPLVQRLRDKVHAWGYNGVSSLVPCELAQGLIGLPYNCPDMIGGGEYLDFARNAGHLDQELFVRYAQNAALMPMMQFSAAPWRVLDEKHNALCREAALLHERFGETIVSLAREAARTGEPIVRYLAYQFPGEGLEKINDEFLLGDSILVAPVTQKRVYAREVRFPLGRWRAPDGAVYPGGQSRLIDCPLDTLLYFIRLED